MKYPLFKNPQQYLQFRKGGFLSAPVKRWAEWRSLDRCLKGLDDIKTVCDCPCGPGRVFPYWKKRGFNLIATDLSDEMVDAARRMQTQLNIAGGVLKADAFDLSRQLTEKPDLVASIRFFYYFDKPTRIRLLQSFAQVSSKYLLLQYKTPTTIKGRISFFKSLRSTHPKHFCSYKAIINEITQAGLIPMRLVPMGDASDRLFVLAQKPDKKIAMKTKSKIYYPRTLRNSLLAAAAVILMFVSYNRGLIGDIHERQVRRIVQKYQDGNDHFYIAHSPHLEDLRTGKWLSFISDVDDAPKLAAIDKTESEDSYFLIRRKDVPNLKETPLWAKLSVLEEIKIGKKYYVLLSTEKSDGSNKNIPDTSFLTPLFENNSRV